MACQILYQLLLCSSVVFSSLVRAREAAPGTLLAQNGPPDDPLPITRSAKIDPWARLGRFWSIFGRSKRDLKINDFSTPPKSTPELEKISHWAPEGPFFMDFEVILASIVQAFWRHDEMS